MAHKKQSLSPAWNTGYAFPEDDELSSGFSLPDLDRDFARMAGGGVVMKLEGLGSDVAPYGARQLGIFGEYGRRAAASLMRAVEKAPPAQRADVMKQAMDAIEPGLHQRAKQYAERAAKSGAPARAALAHGIAAATTEGILSELEKLGRTRRAPKSGTIVGLGCFGRPPMGDIASMQFSVMAAPSNAFGPLICMRPGYTWMTDHWERSRAGVPDNPGPGDANGQCLATETRVNTSTTPVLPTLKFGSWTLRDVEGQRTSFAWASVTPVQAQELLTWIAKGSAAYLVTRLGVSGSMPPPTPMISLSDAGIAPSSSKVPTIITDGKYPIAKFTHPASGKREQIFLERIGTKAAPAFALVWKYDPSLGEAAWKAFYELHAVPTRATVDFLKPIVKGAIDSIKDLTCKTVSQPGAVQAGQAAAVAGPYGMAIAAGTTIAANQCGGGGGGEAPLPPPVDEPASYTIPIALAAVGAGAILYFNKKRKKSA